MTDYRKNGSAVGGGGGMANPMTTVGDIVVGDTVSGGVAAPARLGAGASGYILRSVAGTPAWRELSAAGLGDDRPNAVATREGQTYWSTDAAAGSELAMCVHKGGATYAWEILAYGAPGLPSGGTSTDVLTGDDAWTPRIDVVFGGIVDQIGSEPEGTGIVADGAGDVRTTSADVSAVLAAADAAAARAALGAAPAGPTGVGLGGLSVSVGPAGTSGPTGGKGWTLAACIYVASVGGGAVRCLWSCSNGSTRGWGIVLDISDVPQVFVLGGTTNPTLGTALATGWHKIGFSLAADGLSYNWAVDGAGAGNVAISNAATAPSQSADLHEIGNWINGFYDATNLEFFHLLAINGVATAAQLAAMTATPSDGRITVPASLAALADMDLCFADAPGYLRVSGWTHVCRGTGRRVLVTAGTPTVVVR